MGPFFGRVCRVVSGEKGLSPPSRIVHVFHGVKSGGGRSVGRALQKGVGSATCVVLLAE
jgi:hypothetical protein